MDVTAGLVLTAAANGVDLTGLIPLIALLVGGGGLVAFMLFPHSRQNIIAEASSKSVAMMKDLMEEQAKSFDRQLAAAESRIVTIQAALDVANNAVNTANSSAQAATDELRHVREELRETRQERDRLRGELATVRGRVEQLEANAANRRAGDAT